jgi:regulator of replication initiation timing
MDQVNQVNQVADMERRVRQTASTMTALQAVTQAVLEEINNHGTLEWHWYAVRQSNRRQAGQG